MPRPLDQATINAQIEAVGTKLDEPRLTKEKRLVLLRRQAQLGDLRDAIAKRARRVTERRTGTP